MDVDDPYPGLGDGIQEGGREDVHPAGEDDELGPLVPLRRQDLLRQRGVVLLAGFGDGLVVRLPLSQEAMADEVEVLPRDA